MSDEEARQFLCASKPELVDFPGLAAGLGSHLAPVLRKAKAEAIRRSGEVSRESILCWGGLRLKSHVTLARFRSRHIHLCCRSNS